MSETPFYKKFEHFFALDPTSDQHDLFIELENFLRRRNEQEIFLLKGYAGTGKTSVLGAFVKTLSHFKVKTKLLAPTGRAAKVLANKSGHDAFTIHKQIYWRKSKTDLSSPMTLRPNLHKNTIFIVDESSMIGDYTMQKDGSISARNLLEDLTEFVFQGAGCKLILLGDEGQLPPVGSDYSPAMSVDYLKHHFPSVNITSFKLDKVLRQATDSEILRNATILRNTKWESYPRFEIVAGSDLIRLQGAELQDELESSYNNFGVEDTIVITRSNKAANTYNQQIRGRILWFEEELCAGDCLMAVKNNYFWQDDSSKMGFIANGELFKVKRILKYEEYYGFRFARAIVSFFDYEDLGDIEIILHLETLTCEGPNLERNRMKELFFAVEEDYSHIRIKKDRYEAILKDPYFNALQVKYAYAVTCHKSQGGQWAHVYIDQGYITEEMMGEDFYRWMYTALTRASEKAYLVNFMPEFFVDED
jgi:exodeoxyribonuclease-5